MQTKKLTIGLFGFGVVGEGIYNVLQDTPSLQATIKKICIRHPEKKRNAPAEFFTTDANDLLNDEQINLVVELIDSSEAAFSIVSRALSSGRAVVSANKNMIAENFSTLYQLQQLYGVPLLYEAAVCGSIPVLRNLEEYYNNDLLKNICGIVNGSTNFILTKIIGEKLNYAEALQLAQKAGFAESNPALDVNGIDAANKLSILLIHAYGLMIKPSSILCKGIVSVDNDDAALAGEKGFRIKLIARALTLQDGSIAAMVLPHFITAESQLFNVSNENNGIVIETGLADKQFLYGKGAGRYPASSAVLSDIAALRYDYKYEYRKFQAASEPVPADDFYLRVYVSFQEWYVVNRSELEWIEEFHGTDRRQYIIGVIHYQKLKNAKWLYYKDVSVIVMPDGIVEKNQVHTKTIQKLSLKLAGLN